MARTFLFSLLLVSSFVNPVNSQPQLTEKWRFVTHGWIVSSPAIDQTGTIYFGSYDHYIYAVNPDGSEKWKYRTGDIVAGSPSIDNSGNIYIGSQDSYFYSLKPNGTLNWKLKLGSPVSQFGAIGTGPTIYVSADRLYAIDQAGQIIWTSESVCNGYAAPVVGHDGTIYVSGNGISALTPDGTLKWTFPFTGSASYNEAGCTPAIGPDGILYVGSKDNYFYAINPDGTKKWSCKTGTWVMTSPVLLAEGKICFCSNDCKMYLLTPDGRLINSKNLGPFAPATLCLGKDGFIYTSLGRSLMAIDTFIEALDEIQIHYNDSSYPVIAPNGTIYLGTSGGESGGDYQSDSYFFAVESNSGGLGETHWPKYGKDAQNTGSVFDPQSPVARISSSMMTCNANETVILDGSSSTSPSWIPLSYQWKCTLKPNTASPTIQDADKAIARVTLNTLGTYRFQLQVSDGSHPVSIAAVTVHCGYIEFEVPGGIAGSPAIDDSGIIYIGSKNNYLYAFNPDGTRKWSFRTGRDVMTPAIGSDGTIYVSSNDQTFYAVNPDGHEKWRYIGQEGFIDAPAIDALGTIYIHDGPRISALNPDGSERWRFHIESGGYPNSPAIGSDGTLYFCTNAGHIYAINSNGTIKWRNIQNYENYYNSELAIGPGDRLFFNGGGRIYVMNPDGTIAWRSSQNQYFSYVHATIDKEGIFYAASRTYFFAFYPDGRVKWQYKIGDNQPDGYPSYSAIGADGQVFLVTAFDEALFMFDSDGNLDHKFEPLDYYLAAGPAIDRQGRVYVDIGGKLAAVQTGTPGLANKIWPKYRCNNRNTASVHNLQSPRSIIANDTIRAGLNQTVILDGSPSSDPDKDPLTFLWRCAQRPEDGQFVLTDSTDSRASVRIEGPGIYKFSLTVRDPDDGTSVAIVTVISGVKWKKFYSGNHTQVVIDKKGTLYLGHTGGLVSLNADGTEKWEYPTVNSDELSAPAIDTSGTIYYACSDSLLAFYLSGIKKWGISPSVIKSSLLSPSISADGTLYVGLRDEGLLLAINPDGTTKWRFSAESGIFGPPAIGKGGTIYFGSLNGKLFAVKPDGTERWSFLTNGFIPNSPAISDDGTIYIGSVDNFCAINPNGTKKWQIETAYSIYSPPVIGYGGTVFFSTPEGVLYAVRSYGEVEWTFKLEGYSLSNSPVIGADSTIYIPDQGKKIYALAPNGKIKWIYRLDYEANGAISLGPDGKLYCSDRSGYLHAIQTASRGLARTSWPKYKHDYQNSGLFGPIQTAVKEHPAEGNGLPSTAFLFQNYPNPFNPTTTIRLYLPNPGHVTLYVYNILGHEISRLIDGLLKAGEHRVQFDAEGLATGIYFYRIESENFHAVKKMVVLE